MALSSYATGTTVSGEVRLLKDLDTALAGRDVLIVEDIVDTGLTLNYLREILMARGPRSVRTACLLSKPSRRKVDVRVEYIGFTIEDHFVVGYGLDYDRPVSIPSAHRDRRRRLADCFSRTRATAISTPSRPTILRASASTAAHPSSVRACSLISTLPLTMTVSTSSPRVV